nr:dTDP-4-dehydrorhamnose reductase [Paracidobacterium acidisoli]
MLLGANGQVGTELQRSFAGFGKVIACDRSHADLSRPAGLRNLIREVHPQVILNAAAYTAVDRAESDQELATAINATAPGVLAEEAARLDALLVHYSTDYVFNGAKTSPWIETDTPAPLNVYGASKLAGERAIQAVDGRHLIFRTSWVYGPHGKNFLLTMLRLGRERDELRIVDDQIGAPTSSLAIAHATRSAVDKMLSEAPLSSESRTGIYHLSCEGEVSWCGFAREIFSRGGALLHGRQPCVAAIQSEEYPTPAIRPRYSVLSNEKLHSILGVKLPPWQIALDEVLSRLQA